jgi:diguanylate cyclase (GGDEF)-like protein
MAERRKDREVTKVVAGPAAAKITRDRGVLTLLSGPEAGRVVPIPPEGIKLGRSDECDVHFDDNSLSREHAFAIKIGGGKFVLRDYDSTNGTFVNGARVGEAVELGDNDRIQLGSATALRFSLVDEIEERTLMQVFTSARTDPLTGIANRKALDERIEAEVAYALRHEEPVSLAMMDIDLFKRINDTFGHPAGDAVIRSVATTLARSVRTEDVVGRYGGEEFCVVLRGVEDIGACIVADRIRVQIGATPVRFEGREIPVTVSAGVASLETCGAQRTKDSLVATADERLYKAKQRGRNMVIGPGEGGSMLPPRSSRA